MLLTLYLLVPASGLTCKAKKPPHAARVLVLLTLLHRTEVCKAKKLLEYWYFLHQVLLEQASGLTCKAAVLASLQPMQYLELLMPIALRIALQLRPVQVLVLVLGAFYFILLAAYSLHCHSYSLISK